MVPTETFPPGMPLTLQVTEVLEAFVTVAAKVCVFPRITELLCGVTVTWICGGGGGGLLPFEPELCEQPRQNATLATADTAKHAHWIARERGRAILRGAEIGCERGRMRRVNAVEGPAK
jgi:hypothetical protein